MDKRMSLWKVDFEEKHNLLSVDMSVYKNLTLPALPSQMHSEPLGGRGHFRPTPSRSTIITVKKHFFSGTL